MIQPGEEERKLWDREYGELQVIPSSTRPLPSKALLLFAELLDLNNKVVLDAGCGTGRNAIYLAHRGCEVHAVDFSRTALAVLEARAEEAGVSDRLRVYPKEFPPLPFADRSFDAVLDIYVLCHFLDDGMRKQHLQEMRRVLKPSGHLISVNFAADDGYYQPMLQDGVEPIIRDPAKGIRKRLFSEREARGFLKGSLSTRYFCKFEFDDIVVGKRFRRSILASVLQPLD